MAIQYTSQPEFWPGDVAQEADPDIRRRALVVIDWLDNILASDLKGKSNQLSMVVETRARVKKYGESTRFTEKQFYYLRGIWEKVTGDESDEKY